MTLPAEMITIEFDGEPAIWAPTDPEVFWSATASTWTPNRLQRWFAESAPPTRGLAKLLGPPMPMSVSTALGAPAMRYVVRGGLLMPQWAAFSAVDAEALAERAAPDDCRFETRDHIVYMHFHDPAPLQLDTSLGLMRCERSPDGLHWYVCAAKQFSREPERFVEPSNGADGHV